ncbi:MAG: methylmalonyl-CoA epimerase [Planctomycetota bacterium]|nr:MAG: methylmalonyl-CoA epimerase [Planctomycetota bacterium]
MLNNVDHIGIAVKSIDSALAFYKDVLGLELHGVEEVPSQKVRVAFTEIGGVHLEFVEATSDDSPIAKFIEKKGEGFQHIAFAVDDLAGKLAALKEKGIRLIDESPRPGAGGKNIAFIHPKATNGVLVELCEKAE